MKKMDKFSGSTDTALQQHDTMMREAQSERCSLQNRVPRSHCGAERWLGVPAGSREVLFMTDEKFASVARGGPNSSEIVDRFCICSTGDRAGDSQPHLITVSDSDFLKDAI